MAIGEVYWHPEAIVDAEAARDWYGQRSPFAARGFLLALDEAISAIARAPDCAPLKDDGCRYYVFPSRYPFTLVYRIVSGVQIVAVAHQKRRPRYWIAR